VKSEQQNNLTKKKLDYILTADIYMNILLIGNDVVEVTDIAVFSEDVSNVQQ
jgi:hypothetical protein